MATWTFVKAGGAPSGTIRIDIQGEGAAGVPEYEIDDTPGATIVTTSDAHGRILSGVDYLVLQGMVGEYVPQPVENRVVTVNGVLTELRRDGTSAQIPVERTADLDTEGHAASKAALDALAATAVVTDQSSVGIDVDGVPYFDEAIAYADSVPILADTDGVPYVGA